MNRSPWSRKAGALLSSSREDGCIDKEAWVGYGERKARELGWSKGGFACWLNQLRTTLNHNHEARAVNRIHRRNHKAKVVQGAVRGKEARSRVCSDRLALESAERDQEARAVPLEAPSRFVVQADPDEEGPGEAESSSQLAHRAALVKSEEAAMAEQRNAANRKAREEQDFRLKVLICDR